MHVKFHLRNGEEVRANVYESKAPTDIAQAITDALNDDGFIHFGYGSTAAAIRADDITYFTCDGISDRDSSESDPTS